MSQIGSECVIKRIPSLAELHDASSSWPFLLILEVVKQRLIQPLITTVIQTVPRCRFQEIFVLPKRRQELPSHWERKSGRKIHSGNQRRGVAEQGLKMWPWELGYWVPVPASSLNQLTRPLKASASLDVDWGWIARSWVLTERITIFTASYFEHLLCVRNCVGATVINGRCHPPGLLAWGERNSHQRDSCTNNHVGVLVIMALKQK